MDQQYLTVSALTKYIKAKLEGDKHLFSIMLKGEISNFKRHSRGHLYYTLKDEGAQISAIMFSRDAERLNFSPKEGDHVLVKGKISLYEPSGTYSIQVLSMELDGIGELYLKYEALKKELELKGYFRGDRKRSIPKFPSVIGVITSPTGAVIEDIKNTVSRRYKLAEIHLYPALVQGENSSESVRSQILLANKLGICDVLIVGRGGGSIEDLWGFNEMPTIDAIYNSKIPIITAIGHETDFTISDFVSDLRAPTPTAAAELATPNKVDLLDLLNQFNEQMRYKLIQSFDQKRRELVYLDERMERVSPTQKLEKLHQDIDLKVNELNKTFIYLLESKRINTKQLEQALKSPKDRITHLIDQRNHLDLLLKQMMQTILDRKSYQFRVLKASLEGINPLKMMDKGFAVIEKNKKVITSVRDVNLDDTLDLKLKDGLIRAVVKEKKEN
ncbi:MAG: exodeoxyribonuclease VII large subunit [Acholeplasmataceae bacterium]|jgi:exodeoxyribonuclease VII large subunit|nr:exodeoxyribonuclease VII large subunit [Acholeplasmataceae bacterium]